MVPVGLSGVCARRMIYYEEHKHISVIQAAVLYPGGCVVIILGVLLLSLHGRGRTLPNADDKKPSVEDFEPSTIKISTPGFTVSDM